MENAPYAEIAFRKSEIRNPGGSIIISQGKIKVPAAVVGVALAGCVRPWQTRNSMVLEATMRR
jgi:hypothetical protein